MQFILSERRIHSIVRSLALRIDRAARREGIAELAVVCVMDGAFIFTADLVRALRTPTRIVFAKATSYDGIRKGRTRMTALPGTLRGQPLLVVDTIYDTGATIERVVRQARRLTNTVWLAVLIEKRGKAPCRVEAHSDRVFVGTRVDDDPFLIGYGLDVDGLYRDLPAIGVFQSDPAGAPKTARAVQRGVRHSR
jgi:hypoxanthine phosphoribosyltransferase